MACRVLSINSHWSWMGTGTQSCTCFIFFLNKNAENRYQGYTTKTPGGKFYLDSLWLDFCLKVSNTFDSTEAGPPRGVYLSHTAGASQAFNGAYPPLLHPTPARGCPALAPERRDVEEVTEPGMQPPRPAWLTPHTWQPLGRPPCLHLVSGALGLGGEAPQAPGILGL